MPPGRKDATMAKGYLAIVLHAHLPFVRHPDYDTFLEERWFFEAMTETYIPIAKLLSAAVRDGVRGRIALSLSPSLLAMMEDELLQERYAHHLDLLVELAEKEIDRNRHDGRFAYLARGYHSIFTEARDLFASCNRRISTLFKDLHDRGILELFTTAATHGLLPMLRQQPKAVYAQVKTGTDYFESIFGFRSKGLWLPECGYYPGVDTVLKDQGIRYFFVESHGIGNCSPAPVYGISAPIFTPSGVAAFGRDQGSSEEVWSSKKGYPGDHVYREFYRDIGHDLELEYIRPYIVGDIRVDTGIKYYRITGNASHKQPYDFYAAKEKAAAHAADFLFKRVRHVEHLAPGMEVAPIITAPFDAELFGHWWFEGPQWIDFLMRKASFDQNSLEMISPGDYLDRHPVHQRAVPCTSTWGAKGFFETWLNGRVDWIYAHLEECAVRMARLANQHGAGQKPADLTIRALNQCLRELFLAQSSDWPFIISNKTSEQYAARRVRDHVSRFHFLAHAIENGSLKEEDLGVLEYIDNIFPNADYRLFLD